MSSLVPGSVAVVIGDGKEAPKWLSTADGVTMFQICESLEAVDGAQIIDIPSGGDFEKNVLHPMLRSLFGKVIGKVDNHFQIDLVVVTGPGQHDRLIKYLSRYIHPGGFIYSRCPLKGFGEPQKTDDWFWYRPEKNPEEVSFAKMSHKERRWIYDRVKELPRGAVYLEIGSYKGGSAVIAAIANPDIDIYCVDPWEDYKDRDNTAIMADFSVFRRHTQFFHNVTPVRININNVSEAPTLIAEKAGCKLEDLSIAMLFIDGDHSLNGVTQDLKAYLPYTKGLVSGHDYGHILSVRKGVDIFFTKNIFKKALMTISPTRLWGTRAQFFFRPACIELFGTNNSIWQYNGKCH
ncbi:hypothetical protein MNBD_NITROSPINAE04-1068 [hydrothermal vent metagenome]|uniref:Class I SAM-dependent methyltransferase n=1 Tax=hydrothermal vent metagenome TaxID=652676 RepID=A0A3B1BVU1_9ZZZZ